ncbi:type IV pilus assembly protein PilP [Methylomarinovum caldicuralii]|uniref:Type IV pilus assembly protein PilP n=2 Tax=Methylomarinovum caldicuralii TaxID=438856 RepID=A0AAU9CSQ4_9GAMM|nr:type IV pilus assembly protein PilP [Methylomarinovum caldicuralii]
MFKRMRKAMALIPAVFLVGCGDRDISDLEAYVAEVKARPKGSIEPLPEIKIMETFVFDPEGLRDPFAPAKQALPPQVAAGGSGIKPDPTRPKEPLEAYDLDSLRMVGTVKKDAILWALIQTGEGTIYRVRTGNYLGKNHGRIVRITEEGIDLVEIFPDGPGTWRERQASLALAE